jgi:NitT/TauT family transport system permease protein
LAKQLFPTQVLKSEGTGLTTPSARTGWVDGLIVLGLAGLLFGLIDLGRSWGKPINYPLPSDLSPWALPRYALLSLTRILLAFVLALAFALTFGYWAVKDALAGRVILPLVDIFRRSVPALGLMPVLVLALLTVFPERNFALEIGTILVIVMAQVWPLTTSFRHALRLVPHEQQEMATAFHFSPWQRFRWVELPWATTSLVWNSMLCVARGWFVLMVSEAFMLGHQNYQVPGLGSYMSMAVAQERWDAVVGAVAVMTLMIVALDFFLWRPMVVWAQKFRVEEESAAEPMSCWFLDWLRRSRLLRLARRFLRRWLPRRKPRPQPERAVPPATPLSPPSKRGVARRFRLAHGLVAVLVVPVAFGVWSLAGLLLEVSPGDWAALAGAALVTLGRVALATALGVLVALPLGLAIGLSPRWSGVFQPVVQILASFPVPLVFPLVVAGLGAAGVPLGWGSILLMFLATQSYILFNVIAGATAIPAELKEAVRSYRLPLRQRIRCLYFPAVLPNLLTGWDAAAGACWNICLVAEYLTLGAAMFQTRGLGAAIADATRRENIPLLAAGVVVLCLVLWALDRTVWRLARRLAEERYSLN